MTPGFLAAAQHSVWIAALGTALLHLLWQGALIALAVALVQTVLKRASAGVRYAVALIGLALLPLAFTVTLLAAHARGALALVWMPHVLARLPQLLPWLVAIWLIGVLLFGLHALGGWCLLQRVRRRVQLPAAWLAEQFAALVRRAGMASRARLALSGEITAPCALGFWRPLVLLPLSAVTALSPEQLEAILAHELAHIRRCDYLINLFQRALEVLFFYHPAVWWLSRQVAQEREHCCDDAAIALCGDRVVYAHALLTLAGPTAPVMSVAAVGGSLPQRLRRILGQARPFRPWRLVGGLLLLAGISTLLLAPVPPRPVSPPLQTAVAPVQVARRLPASFAHAEAPRRMARSVVRRPLLPTRPAPDQLKISVTLAAFQTCAPQFVWVRQSDDFGNSWATLVPVLHCQQVLAPVLHVTT